MKIREEIHVTYAKRGKNACDQVAIGFGFAPDWLSRWRELSKPIIERNKAKPNEGNYVLLSTLRML